MTKKHRSFRYSRVFPGRIKPVRKGFYLRLWEGIPILGYWSGEEWKRYGVSSLNPYTSASPVQDLRWYGLSSPHKES